MSADQDDDGARKPIAPPLRDRPRDARRAVAEAVAQITPLTAGLARLYQTTHPPAFEERRQDWEEEISTRSNEHDVRLDRHERILMPRRKPLEGAAAGLVVALAHACPDGLARTYYTPEQLGQLLPDVDPAEIEAAVFDLEADRLLMVQRFVGGEWRVRLGQSFYAQIDHQVMGWGTKRDAVEIAQLIVDDPVMGRATRIHERLDWTLRRLNPALSFLASKVLASKTHDRTYATPEFPRHPDNLAALRRFIRKADASGFP